MDGEGEGLDADGCGTTYGVEIHRELVAGCGV
jgi:hypothetical protein